MKIREGFISNSSSSCFVVVSNNGNYHRPSLEINNGTLIIGDHGNMEFGWEFEKFYGFWDKVNWAVMQAHYSNMSEQRIAMIKKVIMDAYPEVKEIDIRLKSDDDGGDRYSGYIDHQSVGESEEIFDNESILRNFIFGANSYVQGGNDNV